jgi:hypothetical protein
MRDTLARSITRTKDLDLPVSMVFAGYSGHDRPAIVQVAPAEPSGPGSTGHAAQLREHMLNRLMTCDNLGQ